MTTKQRVMEADVKTVSEVIEIARRRWRSIVVPAAVLFAFSAVYAFSLPKKYQSTTTIIIEEQEVPREYVSTNITSYVDQRLQTINQRIMSTTRLVELIDRLGLYTDLKDKIPLDEIVAKMRKDIKFNMISADVINPLTGAAGQATIAFSITYEGKAPETVQMVAKELASLYLGENLKARERQSSDTYNFLENEMKDVQVTMEDLDARIASYKQKNITSLPELSQINLQAIDQVDRDIARMDAQLRTLRDREGYLAQQLVSIPPDLAQELRRRLVELKTRYSDEHPDVISTRAEIKELERRLGDSGGGAAGGKPDNPAYITLASQLAGVKSEVGSINRQIEELKSKRNEYRKRIEASPRTEEGYRTLIANRNNLQAKYDDLTRKAMDAKVAHGLEKGQLGERFSVIDPARLPSNPITTRKRFFLLIGLILGLGSGVGLACLQESTDITVRCPDHLARAVLFPVLASIPEIVTEEEIARKKKQGKLLIGTVIVLTVGLLGFSLLILEPELIGLRW